MIIVGAGLSGLLAGQFFRSRSPVILERQKSLPNNHHALLRFRSSKVSDVTQIDFKKVRVSKAVYDNDSHSLKNDVTLKDMNLYSHKVTMGSYINRSIASLDSVERYIAPPDLISQLSRGLSIDLGSDINNFKTSQCPVISTIPVYDLAKHLDYDLDCELKTMRVHTLTMEIPNCELYQTVYFPTNKTSMYRLSITGNRVIAEFVNEILFNGQSVDIDHAANFIHQFLFAVMGIKVSDQKVTHNEMQYGKLIPEQSSKVKDFIGWATKEYNIYSVGRWATHRQILMDDVIDDLRVVNRMIASNNYNR